jgi:hypothetical protein
VLYLAVETVHREDQLVLIRLPTSNTHTKEIIHKQDTGFMNQPLFGLIIQSMCPVKQLRFIIIAFNIYILW